MLPAVLRSAAAASHQVTKLNIKVKKVFVLILLALVRREQRTCHAIAQRDYLIANSAIA
jgi:hypothetical protein